MNALTIDPEILALNDVSSSEKLLLAVYHKNPGAKSSECLRVLGVGLSGLKKIKGRLMQKHLLRITASENQVLVLGLLPEAEAKDGHFVTKIQNFQKVEKVASRTAAVVAQEIRELFNSVEEMVHSQSGIKVATFSIWSAELTKLIEEAKPLFGPEGAAILADYEHVRNDWTARSYAAYMFKDPNDYFRIACMLDRAGKSQLADLYERIKNSRQLGYRKEPLQIEEVLTPITTCNEPTVA